jgi:hypothetical protein
VDLLEDWRTRQKILLDETSRCDCNGRMQSKTADDGRRAQRTRIQLLEIAHSPL